MQKRKKPVGIIAGLVIISTVLIVVAIITANSKSQNGILANSSNVTESNPSTKPTIESTTIIDNTLSPTELSTENEFQRMCQKVDYKTLARNPEEITGTYVTVSGEVDFVKEASETDPFEIELRITKKTSQYSDYTSYEDEIIIHGYYNPDSGHIIDGDIITIWGESEGILTQEKFGYTKSYPCVSVKYYSIISPPVEENKMPHNNDTKAVNDESYKKSCVEVGGVNLERFPDRYFEKKIRITGEVYYVKELGEDNAVEIQILTVKNDYGYSLGHSAIIRGSMKGNSRILKDDIITVWGTGGGLRYKANYAAEPIVDMEYYTIEE